MDGTLLDLRFDNWFWQEHVPAVWAALHGLTREVALERLRPRFDAARGRLDWYCIDYWSRELGLDIRRIKEGVREQVAWIPGAEAFLRRLKAQAKRRVLVTNAHPEALAIKDSHVDLVGHLGGRHLSAGSPLQHDHRQPRLFFELRIGELLSVRKCLRVDFPEHAPSGVLGQLLECLEPQRPDGCEH